MECQHKIGKNWRKKKTRKSNIQLITNSLLFFACLTSCSKNYSNLITQSIENQCAEKEEECSVSFVNTFDLTWDTLYIFDSMLYPSEISKTLGFKYNGEIVPEGKRLFVFIKDRDIIEEKTLRFTNITFVDMKKNGAVKIIKQATYLARKKIINNKVQFLLSSKEI